MTQKSFSTILGLFALLLQLLLTGCGGGSSSSPPPPPSPDFSLLVSPASISLSQAAETSTATVSVAGQNNFSGSVSLTLSGMPAGVAVSPGSPFSISAGGNQVLTFSASGVAPAGPATITIRGTSGSLSHSLQLGVTVNATAPVVSTFQEGTRLILQTSVGNETARVGLESLWGGTVVEASFNAVNFVNLYDDGREVQVALYDGNAQYDSCAGCTGVFGWDPVQGGDRYVHGSPLLAQLLTPNSIYIKTQPYEWYPDDKGGSSTSPVMSDVILEQTLTPVAGHPRAFCLHYRVTHFGADEHAAAGQEFPAVYVNLGYDHLLYYGGATPWSSGPLTTTLLPIAGVAPPVFYYVPERWAALADDQNRGLAIYVPAQYPYAAGQNFPGAAGETGFGSNYFRPEAQFGFGLGAVLEGDIYLVVGDVPDARRAIYDLHTDLPPADIFSPLGYADQPAANTTVSGTISVAGWAFDDSSVSKVEILVDDAVAGMATYGTSRPDVATVYPNAPANVGFTYSLDTLAYANGSHLLRVKATDTSGNVSLFPVVPIAVSN